jgi:hypothetical protein
MTICQRKQRRRRNSPIATFDVWLKRSFAKPFWISLRCEKSYARLDSDAWRGNSYSMAELTSNTSF